MPPTAAHCDLQPPVTVAAMLRSAAMLLPAAAVPTAALLLVLIAAMLPLHSALHAQLCCYVGLQPFPFAAMQP